MGYPAAVAALSSLALAAAMAQPAPAEAQGPWIKRHLPVRNQWELGAFTGAFFIHKEHDFYDPQAGRQKRIAKVGPEAGLRAAYFPLSFLGVEAEWSGVWTKVIAADDAPAFIYGFRAHALLQLPLFRVAPYLLGGYGLLGIRSPRDAAGNDIDPAGHYGGGVKLFADGRFAVRAEARHYMAASQHRRNRIASHISVLVGLSVRLGPQPHRRQAPEPKETGEVVKDTDGDGRLDPADRCPWEAGDGPDGCKVPDFDGDGILDIDDECPREAGPTPTGCIPAEPEPEPPPEPEPEPEPPTDPDTESSETP